MNRASLWIAAAVLGAAASLIAGAAGTVGLGFLLLSLLLLLRRPRLLAPSGFLTGAGAFWLLLLWRQFASGGSLDQPTPWVAVGVAALTIGAVLTTAEMLVGPATEQARTRSRHPPSARQVESAGGRSVQ